MSKDPIVEEIRTIREQHAKRFGYALDAIFGDIKQQEQSNPKKAVSFPSKPVSPQDRKTA